MRGAKWLLVGWVLVACQSWAQALPAPAAPGRAPTAEPALAEPLPRPDERKVALREALKQRREASGAEGTEPSRRSLNPQERAELRQQLREQSFAGRRKP